MANGKHTPGPWSIHKNQPTFIRGNNTKKHIASTTSFGDRDECEANARLIAAAPDLLEFAQEWLDRQGTDENYMTAKVRAAIAKATGSAA